MSLAFDFIPVYFVGVLYASRAMVTRLLHYLYGAEQKKTMNVK